MLIIKSGRGIITTERQKGRSTWANPSIVRPTANYALCSNQMCGCERDKRLGKQSGWINERGRNVLSDPEGATFDPEG
jgi:hypothetical protein